MLLLQLNICVNCNTHNTHTHTSNTCTDGCGLFIYTMYITYYFMVMVIQTYIRIYIHIIIYELLYMMSSYYISLTNLRLACRLHFLHQRKPSTFKFC